MPLLRTDRGTVIQQAGWCGILLVAFGGFLAIPAFAQQSGSNAQSSPPAKDKQADSSHKNAAQENPFPEATSEHAAQQKNHTQDAPDAPQPDQQAPVTHKPGSAAEENPFPEDVSKSAAAAAAKDSTGSPSSSSSSSNPDGGNPNADIPPESPHRRGSGDADIQTLTPVGQVKEDVRVGRFYLGNGNYKGAYSRFSEATRLDPSNVDAIYGVAAAADGLHHTDEALTNYKLYLAIAPDGKEAKSARKAIRSLSK